MERRGERGKEKNGGRRVCVDFTVALSLGGAEALLISQSFTVGPKWCYGPGSACFKSET